MGQARARVLSWLWAVWAVGAGVVWTAEAAPPPGPLGEAEAGALRGVAEDDPPPKGLISAHYYAGNEDHLHLYKPHLTGLGGAYVGVGPDQAYIFIGWQRPEVAWLTDYDDAVVAVHRVHLALLRAAATPDDFVALWHPDQLEAASGHLDAAYGGDPQLGYYKKILKRAGGHIHGRLKRVRRFFGEHGGTCYLNDQGDYDFVRRFVEEGRAHTLRCDLTGPRCLQSVGEAARSLGVVVRVLYMSNAEQFFPYSAQFKDNMRALPFDSGSVVVRTLARVKDYAYEHQGALDFMRWLDVASAGSFRDIKREPQPQPSGLIVSLPKPAP